MKLEQQQQEVIDMLTQLFDEARRQYYELVQKVAKGDQAEVDRMMAEYEQNFELIRNPPRDKTMTISEEQCSFCGKSYAHLAKWGTDFICGDKCKHDRDVLMNRRQFNTEELTSTEKLAQSFVVGMLAHSTRYKPREGASDNWHEAIVEEAFELADAFIAKAFELQKAK